MSIFKKTDIANFIKRIKTTKVLKLKPKSAIGKFQNFIKICPNSSKTFEIKATPIINYSYIIFNNFKINEKVKSTKIIANNGAGIETICCELSPKIKIGLLPTCTCGGNNEIEWVQQCFSNRTGLFKIYSKFEKKTNVSGVLEQVWILLI